MTLRVSNFIGFNAVGLDSDARSFLSAAAITDAKIVRAINRLAKDLKRFGIWPKMQAIYPLVGGTSTTHKFNLKDPRDLDAAFRLSFLGGSWTHDANGATPNGTTDYANTFFNPVSQSSSTSSFHLSFYMGATPADGTSRMFIGNASDTLLANQTFLGFLAGGTLMYGGVAAVNNSTERTPSAGVTKTAGLVCVSCSGDRSQKYYLNGAATGTPVTATGSYANRNIFLAATNDDETAAFFFNQSIRFTSIGTGLSATDAGNLFTAVELFQDTLGRGVV